MATRRVSFAAEASEFSFYSFLGAFKELICCQSDEAQNQTSALQKHEEERVALLKQLQRANKRSGSASEELQKLEDSLDIVTQECERLRELVTMPGEAYDITKRAELALGEEDPDRTRATAENPDRIDGAEISVDEVAANLPLHIAVRNQDFVGLQELLADRETDVNQCNEGGETPLLVACSSLNGDAVEMLLVARANANLTGDPHGQTPLHMAAWPGTTDILRKLLVAGANPNQANVEGCVPMHFAAADGHWEAMKLLVEFRADVMALNSDFKTASDYAEQAQQDKEVVMELLQRYMSDENAQHMLEARAQGADSARRETREEQADNEPVSDLALQSPFGQPVAS